MGKKGETTATFKGVKLEGQRTFVDKETGEEIQAEHVSVEVRDANFSKIWVMNILSAVNDLTSASLQLVMWLVEKTEKTKGNNVIMMTIRDIAEETGRSTQTVHKVLKVLEAHDVIRRRSGVIWVNPEVIYKGTHKGRMSVLTTYQSVETLNHEAIEDASSRIQRKTRTLQKLGELYRQAEADLTKELDLLSDENLEDMPAAE